MAEHIIVLNVPEVAAALEQAPERLIPAIEKVAKRWLLRRQAKLARYPSQPPGTRYRRTGTLGRTWTSAQPTWRVSASGFDGRIGNSTPYAPFVQGERQARVHQGRWGTVQDIETKATPELEADVRAAVAALEQQINGVSR